ncbi:hypothetical protein N7533_005948 [Penicillium manginii]|uniref:uncharacterized protein n=1 Tax=Penicillium manginii TaxID=203109 RepID=UPI0025488849|nr:uncharacterized protein N7533_005948 [Penicillium manginii]KAJ5756405.1 hypothetical protein N7533_005948 [Penicillium manginii]
MARITGIYPDANRSIPTNRYKQGEDGKVAHSAPKSYAPDEPGVQPRTQGPSYEELSGYV